MTTKTVAWTKETTAKLIAAYGKGETTLKELSAMFGKSEAAIRGKLVSEISDDNTEEGGIYQFEVSAEHLENGLYYYNIRSGTENIRKTLEVKR